MGVWYGARFFSYLHSANTQKRFFVEHHPGDGETQLLSGHGVLCWLCWSCVFVGCLSTSASTDKYKINRTKREKKPVETLAYEFRTFRGW